METIAKERFSLVESYSHRYKREQERRRPASLSLTDSDIKSREKGAYISSPVNRNASYLLRPCEVLQSQYVSVDVACDQLFQRAFRQRAEGFFKSSALLYTELLKLRPMHVPARLNLGVCYMKLGQLESAWETCRLAVLQADCDARLLYNAAILKAIRGDKQAAEQLLDSAVTTASDPLIKDISRLREALEAGQFPPSRLLHHSNSQHSLSALHPSPTTGLQRPKANAKSLSFSKPTTPLSGFIAPFDRPRPMWGVFKTVNQYISGTGTTASSSPSNITHVSPSTQKHRPKGSFITSNRTRIRHRRQISEDSGSARPSTVISRPSGEGLEGKEILIYRNRPLERVRMHGALLEEDLEDEKALRSAQVDEALELSVKAKAAEVSAVIRKEADKLYRLKDLLPDIDLDPVLPHQLTAENLHMVQAEMRKEPESRDYGLLVNRLGKLKFFAKFQLEVRRKFLEISHLQIAQPREIVFDQGDPGLYMYVILHGSVAVTKHSPEYGADPLVLTTLYDGENFGDLSVFLPATGKGRSASCMAVEVTELLVLPKEKYHQIILSEIETQLDSKIAFLGSLPLFKGTPEPSLIPLASNIDPVIFKFSERLITKGSLPQGLSIILSGTCNLYSEGFCLRPKLLGAYARARIRSPEPAAFRTGNTDFHSPKRRESDAEATEAAISAAQIATSPRLKSALEEFFPGQDVSKLAQTHYITRERMLKMTLKPKDYFGGRVLLEPPTNSQPSKYTVQAESSEVKAMIVTRALLPLLGDRVTEQARRYLRRQEDCDCPQKRTVEEIDEEFRSWAEYRMQVVDQARKDQSRNRVKVV